MTIAAGFVCTDGILFASDTLYSSANKRYGRKLWMIRAGGTVICLGGAGSQAGLQRVQYELRQRVSNDCSRTRVIETIEGVLQEVAWKQPSESDHTQGLFAIRTPNEEDALLENAGYLLSPVGHPSHCVGYAEILGHYFQDLMYVQPMPLKWARVVAAHIIKQAKHYSSYCGGETHLLELPVSGEPEFIDDQSRIAVLEGYLVDIDAAIRAILPDGRANDDTLEHRLSVIGEAIRKVEKTFVLKGETAVAT